MGQPCIQALIEHALWQPASGAHTDNLLMSSSLSRTQGIKLTSKSESQCMQSEDAISHLVAWHAARTIMQGQTRMRLNPCGQDNTNVQGMVLALTTCRVQLASKACVQVEESTCRALLARQSGGVNLQGTARKKHRMMQQLTYFQLPNLPSL